MFDYRELVIAVTEMRKAQKAYELKHFDELLTKKRLEEKNVDRLLAEIEEERKPKQETLF